MPFFYAVSVSRDRRSAIECKAAYDHFTKFQRCCEQQKIAVELLDALPAEVDGHAHIISKVDNLPEQFFPGVTLFERLEPPEAFHEHIKTSDKSENNIGITSVTITHLPTQLGVRFRGRSHRINLENEGACYLYSLLKSGALTIPTGPRQRSDTIVREIHHHHYRREIPHRIIA